MSEGSFSRVGIIGVGLIGGSLALAIKKKYKGCRIIGYGLDEKRLEKAKESKVIDEHTTSFSDFAETDLIVFATPINAFEKLGRQLVNHIREDTIVIDVGSVKAKVVKEMEQIFSSRGRFVGTHPIAGSEKTGFENAKAELFENARVVVTPTERTDKVALMKICNLWQSLGATVDSMSPEEHDRIYGLVSHLPHLLSFCLVNTVSSVDRGLIKYAGSGFRDTTRIGKSSPELWRDILIANREVILEHLERFISQLELVKDLILNQKATELYNYIKNSKELRETLDS